MTFTANIRCSAAWSSKATMSALPRAWRVNAAVTEPGKAYRTNLRHVVITASPRKRFQDSA